MKKIYIAAGCFWGVEEYFSYITGIISTKVGFANGFKPSPTFRNITENKNGYTEACEIIYNDSIISLETILEHMFKIINPVSINKQGNNSGTKYRTGIYHQNEDIKSKDIALRFIKNQQQFYTELIAVEIEPITTFFLALETQQQYLKKNPTGYCHIPQKLIEDLKIKK